MMLKRLALIAALMVAALPGPVHAEPRLGDLRLPPGYAIDIFARIPGARSMAVAEPLSVVFVGTRRHDKVYAVRYKGGRATSVEVVLSGLNVPNGIAWAGDWLYVAEQHRIVRYRASSIAALKKARPQVLFDDLPDAASHGWRYAAFGPDGWLYVSVGAPCNVCQVGGLEGTIIRLGSEGGAPEIFARGIRNSVGMAFHPSTGDLFFTDNGADRMGDDVPPDELNRAHRPGLHFGYPFYGGGDARTPQFQNQPRPAAVQFPEIRFGAHVAALGIHFYGGRMLTDGDRESAFVAQHGSWNRTIPDGYRVVRVNFDEAGRAISHKPFIEGWLMKNGQAWGRPVDIKELPDGALLVSDDKLGAIYRVTYKKP